MCVSLGNEPSDYPYLREFDIDVDLFSHCSSQFEQPTADVRCL